MTSELVELLEPYRKYLLVRAKLQTNGGDMLTILR